MPADQDRLLFKDAMREIGLELPQSQLVNSIEKGLEFAKLKPKVVIGSMEEFSKPQYKVDVLKVEVPINANYVEGSSVYKGQKAYSRSEALDLFRKAASVATKPFIYLSAGVGNAQFVEELNMAAEAGTSLQLGRSMSDGMGSMPAMRAR